MRGCLFLAVSGTQTCKACKGTQAGISTRGRSFPCCIRPFIYSKIPHTAFHDLRQYCQVVIHRRGRVTERGSWSQSLAKGMCSPTKPACMMDTVLVLELRTCCSALSKPGKAGWPGRTLLASHSLALVLDFLLGCPLDHKRDQGRPVLPLTHMEQACWSVLVPPPFTLLSKYSFGQNSLALSPLSVLPKGGYKLTFQEFAVK